MSANTTIWDILNTKTNVCFFHPTEDCEKKCKRSTCLKRPRKRFKLGENCKYKLKFEFRHDETTYGQESAGWITLFKLVFFIFF